MSATEIQPVEYPETKLARTPTPMDLLQLAIQKEGSIDVIERLAALQMQIQDREDKIAFSQAMASFRDNMPVIIRERPIYGKKDAQGNPGPVRYKAVALEDVATPLSKALLEHGISYRFKSADLPDGRTRVTCYLRLKGTAYEEEGATLAAPPDTSGDKDALKAVGSTVSYLEKYTLLQSCGVHVYGSDPEATEPEGITQGAGADWISSITGAATREECMANWTSATKAAAGACKGEPDYKAMVLFTQARDARMLQLRKEGKR
jgi:hypothetical protein